MSSTRQNSRVKEAKNEPAFVYETYRGGGG